MVAVDGTRCRRDGHSSSGGRGLPSSFGCSTGSLMITGRRVAGPTGHVEHPLACVKANLLTDPFANNQLLGAKPMEVAGGPSSLPAFPNLTGVHHGKSSSPIETFSTSWAARTRCRGDHGVDGTATKQATADN